MTSMTGYAKIEFNINEVKFVAIIKSLNSNKGLDLNIKTPKYLIELEPEFKKIIDQHLIRGKIDLKIFESSTTNKNLSLNKKKLRNYISLLSAVSPKSDDGQILNAAIKLPDIFNSDFFSTTMKTKKLFIKEVKKVVLDLNNYRKKEGEKLKKVIKIYIMNIFKITKKLPVLEKKRKHRKKLKLIEQIKSVSSQVDYNASRLESEMIYYFERSDITEERVRLQYHCKFFIEVLNKNKIIGKKLTFVSQEILREINTIGSKANDFEIQKLVVEMKENIEKVKEQLQNIL